MPQEYRDATEHAERAAAAGDFAAAEDWLRRALENQESRLGAGHPDLASTLNNLAVVCETNGRLDDAERFYRRAFALATAARPPGDPLVATSRANLEDFCRAHGRHLEEWPELGAPRPASTGAAGSPVMSKPPSAETAPWTPVTVAQPSTAATSPRAAPSTGVPGGFLAALAALALAGTLAVVWAWWPSEPRPTTEAVSATPAPASTEPPASSPPAAAETAATRSPSETEPAAPAPAPDTSEESLAAVASPAAADTGTNRRDDSPSASDGATARLVDVALCRRVIRSGSQWRCEPVEQPVPAGTLALYTRVAAARPGRVEHRWYRGDRLTRSVGLSIGASPTEGYRTYSQQTVTPGRWRVEVRAGDDLLHEAAFDVRE